MLSISSPCKIKVGYLMPTIQMKAKSLFGLLAKRVKESGF